MQAVITTDGTRNWGDKDLFTVADQMFEWLRETSEPASSAYESSLPVVTQAGAGSETTSPAVRDTSKGEGEKPLGSGVVTEPEAVRLGPGRKHPSPAGDDRGGQSDGEAGCPPHDLDLDVAPKAMRYPCRRCNAWVKPTMAAEEAEEAAK